MTIEQRLNNLLTECNFAQNIQEWVWEETPNSFPPMSRGLQHIIALGPPGGMFMIHKIDEEIQNADPSECLTSNSEYIRECKKFYMSNWSFKKLRL